MASSNIDQIDPKLTAQEVNLTDDDLKFKCPFSMVVSGPSQAGKSFFIYQIVKFRLRVCSQKFTRIIYCQSNNYSPKNQSFIKELQNEFPTLELCQGLPKLNDLHLKMNNEPCLLLIDDLMEEVLNSSSMVNLVSNDCHNFNISVIFVLQNYFAQGRYGKTLIRNCHYKVFFYNRVEQLEMRNISSQVSTNPIFFKANFEFLNKTFPNEKSFYLLIDGHSRSEAKQLWCRSLIFPRGPKNEIEPIIFFPNPDKK